MRESEQHRTSRGKRKATTIDWKAILGAHGALAWRTGYRLLGNRADADDCYQETFLSAFELAGRESIQNWPGLVQHLATIRALEMLRRRKRWGREGLAIGLECFPNTEGDPLQAAQLSELTENLLAAICELPPQQGQAFCLYHLNGCSYEDISHVMNITIDALGVNLHRVRAFLRGKLSKRVSEAEVKHD